MLEILIHVNRSFNQTLKECSNFSLPKILKRPKMAEGLSTTASVIAVAACAAESAKFLFRAFHEAPMIPDHFRQLLSTLTSLHTTLSALQQCSANREAKLRFPRHFHQSLTECQRQLQVWSTKVAKIDAVLQSRKNKSHRSWQKIKWLAVGEKDTNRFLEIIKLYHAEFSLQLLALLLSVSLVSHFLIITRS